MSICKYKCDNKIKGNTDIINRPESFHLNSLTLKDIQTISNLSKTCRQLNQDLINKKIIEIGNRYPYNIEVKDIYLMDTFAKTQTYLKFDDTCILLEFDRDGFKLEQHIRIPKIFNDNELNNMILKFYHQQYPVDIIAYLLNTNKKIVCNTILSKTNKLGRN